VTPVSRENRHPRTPDAYIHANLGTPIDAYIYANMGIQVPIFTVNMGIPP